MWLLPVVVAAAVGVLFYLRWFLKKVDTRAVKAASPSANASVLGASDMVGHAVHEAAWSQVASPPDLP